MSRLSAFCPREGKFVFCFIAVAVIAGVIAGCGSGNYSSPMSGTGTVHVSISDPPSCKSPIGNIDHVWISVRGVEANINGSAGDNDPGWQELAPQLNSAPMQIDLFATSPQGNCILAELGSTTSLPVGTYQQIRLLLVSNTPGASDAVPSTNACAPSGYNCVMVSGSNTPYQIDLSSQANTGLKIPPGQIMGGPLTVSAGQSVDLNIDFNACASIIQQGNGQFRLKPVLTAGQVSPNNSGIGGQVVDSVTKAPIAGNVQVALELPDNTGVDRIVDQAAADASGNFRFCPLPTGTYDIVVVAVGPNNLPYNATAVVNVTNGANLGAIPLVAETGATAPAVLDGFVTATSGTGSSTAGASIVATLSALQSITVSGAARQLTIPLEKIAATSTSPEVDSTPSVMVTASTSCPTGAPAKANCAEYKLVVPGSNPNVGVFSSSGTTYTAPASGDVLFTVDAIATSGTNTGVSDCTPSEITTSKDATNMPLKAVAGSTTNVAEIDFTGCT